MYDEPITKEKASFTEADWNQHATEAAQAYAYTKREAERKAWEV
jgi:hypothetical protein